MRMAENRYVVNEVLGRLADLTDKVDDVDPVELTSEERARGHLRAQTAGGREIVISLPRGTELEEGDVVALEGGVAVIVAATPEDLLEVRPLGEREWGISAYQLGNLHRPVRFGDNEILTPYEVASEEALRSIGVECRRVTRGWVGTRVGSIMGGHAHSHLHD